MPLRENDVFFEKGQLKRKRLRTCFQCGGWSKDSFGERFVWFQTPWKALDHKKSLGATFVGLICGQIVEYLNGDHWNMFDFCCI